MRRITERLTYANVMATVAVFIAIGGSATAAVLITGKNIKNGSIKSVDLAKSSVTSSTVKDGSLLSSDFKPGQLPAGAQGVPGSSGTPGSPGTSGAPGSPGSPAASMLTGRTDTLLVNDKYAYPEGATPGSGFATEAAASTISPAQPIVARDLFVKEDHVSINLLNPRTYSLRVNGLDSPLSCTTDADRGNPTGALQCTDTTHAVTIAPGSTLSLHGQMQATSGGQSETIPVRFGWRATTP